jgi:hypothetical protein
MWISKKTINMLIGKVNEVHDENIRLQRLTEKMVYATYDNCTCEVCGCLVNPAKIVKGKAEIMVVHDLKLGTNFCGKKDVIYYPYYCLIHAPKKEEHP